MDVATRTDQTDKLTQTGNRRANETKVAAGDSKSTKNNSTFIGKDGERHSFVKSTKDNSIFIGKDGERHSFVIPPEKWRSMTPPARTAALAKIRADKGLPPKAVWQRAPPDARCVNSSNTSISGAIETMTS